MKPAPPVTSIVCIIPILRYFLEVVAECRVSRCLLYGVNSDGRFFALLYKTDGIQQFIPPDDGPVGFESGIQKLVRAYDTQQAVQRLPHTQSRDFDPAKISCTCRPEVLVKIAISIAKFLDLESDREFPHGLTA